MSKLADSSLGQKLLLLHLKTSINVDANVPINSKEVDVTKVCAPTSNEIKMKEEIDTLKAKSNSLQKKS
jgi:hypothetical protein